MKKTDKLNKQQAQSPLPVPVLVPERVLRRVGAGTIPLGEPPPKEPPDKG